MPSSPTLILKNVVSSESDDGGFALVNRTLRHLQAKDCGRDGGVVDVMVVIKKIQVGVRRKKTAGCRLYRAENAINRDSQWSMYGLSNSHTTHTPSSTWRLTPQSPALFGLVLCHIDNSGHHLSIFVNPFGVNTVNPSLKTAAQPLLLRYTSTDTLT